MKKLFFAIAAWAALLSPASAANVNIDALPAAASVAGANLFECEQAGTNRQCTGTQIAAFIYSLMSGDATATGGGALTLKNTGPGATGPLGSATVAPIVTIDAQGRVTALASATITPAVGSITGLGTGVATALTVNIGSAGAPVLFNGAGGTPSSLTLTNATGLPLASITGLGTGVATAAAAALNSSTGLIGALTPTNGNCVTGNGTAWTSATCSGGVANAIQPVSGVSSTVPGMTAGSAVADTDLFYASQSSGTNDRKVTGAQVKTYANTSAVRATTTTSEALANSDQNKLVTFSNAAAVACTIAQAGSGGNFAAGWAVSLRNLGAGTVTCTPTTSTVDGATTFILLPGQGLDLYSDGTNYFTQGGRGTIVAKGTLALATSAISSATCATEQTLTVAGLVTTDVTIGSFNGDPTGVTGYVPLTSGALTIFVYPKAGSIGVKVCNYTTGSITPGAITLNLSAVR